MNAKTKKSCVIIFLFILLLGFGCMSQKSPALTEPEKPPAQIASTALFDYEKGELQVTRTFVETKKHWDLYKITYPPNFTGDPTNPEVTAWLYRRRTDKPVGTILQIPILGGDYGPSISFAETFAEAGFHVLRFERKNEILEPGAELDRTRHVMIQSVIDVRRGLDWYMTQPEANPKRIGLCGISMGGFQSSILMAVDKRIQAGALLLNGCDLPRLVVISAEEDVIAFRNALKQKHGWNDDELLAQAQQQLGDIDPEVFAPLLDPTRIFHLSARFDHVVPHELSTRWNRAAGMPKRISIPTGHYSSVIFLHYIKRKCVKYFKTIFADIDPAGQALISQ